MEIANRERKRSCMAEEKRDFLDVISEIKDGMDLQTQVSRYALYRVVLIQYMERKYI